MYLKILMDPLDADRVLNALHTDIRGSSDEGQETKRAKLVETRRRIVDQVKEQTPTV